MKFDLSQPGLYYLLNTPAVKAELARLNLEAKASFEKESVGRDPGRGGIFGWFLADFWR